MSTAAAVTPGPSPRTQGQRAAGVDPRGTGLPGAMPCRAAGRRECAFGWKYWRRPELPPGSSPRAGFAGLWGRKEPREAGSRVPAEPQALREEVRKCPGALNNGMPPRSRMEGSAPKRLAGKKEVRGRRTVACEAASPVTPRKDGELWG